ncbi:MAG: TrmB family transcriptional regulator [Thermoplasmata archaeon]|nr:TrmB family transcriptional regulator [Thermoplasmata archaeon]
MESIEQLAGALGGELSQEYRQAVEVLGRVGLTQYEAKAYIALIIRGVGDAASLAQRAGIPRTSAYKVLESLVAKGYATPAGGKPILYQPKPPQAVAEQLKASITEVFDKLELLHQVVAEHGVPQLVYLVSGKEKVLVKIGEMLDQSVKSFILTTPQIADVREELGRKITHAVKRGVEVTFVTAPHQRVPEGVRYMPRENLLATEVLADGAHALMAAPTLEACGYTDNPILVNHLKQFLDVVQERGAPPSPSG